MHTVYTIFRVEYVFYNDYIQFVSLYEEVQFTFLILFS